MGETEIGTATVEEALIGNHDIINASEGRLVIRGLHDVARVYIDIGPDFKLVKLADGSKTVITERMLEYLEHNGDWEVVD